MIPELREKFNTEFADEKYSKFLDDINSVTNNTLDFRISETPLFLSKELTEELEKAANEVVDLICTEEFKKYSCKAVPENFNIPGEDDHTNFLQIDFAVTKSRSGKLIPQLIELQGFPTVYCYQYLLDEMIRKHFSIPGNLTPYFNDFDMKAYIDLLTEIIVGNYDPENVILMEIEPEKQKTRIDFLLTEKYLGIKTICLTKIIQRGRQLFYLDEGKEIPIRRIYNRVIFDELANKDVKMNFKFTDDLDVTWAGHPNWFFRISKHSLPFIKTKHSPESYFLSELEIYPDNLDNYVLKPLYSFAGYGVEVNVTREMLDSITERKNYILQKKVDYVPLIKTPEGYSKVEIRMMYLWRSNNPENIERKSKDRPVLVNNLVRMSKGKMMGVSFNKDRTWVGSSIAYH